MPGRNRSIRSVTARILTAIIPSWLPAIEFHGIAEQAKTGIVDEGVAIEPPRCRARARGFRRHPVPPGRSRAPRSIARKGRFRPPTAANHRYCGQSGPFWTLRQPPAGRIPHQVRRKRRSRPLQAALPVLLRLKMALEKPAPASHTGPRADLTAGANIPRNRLLAGRFRPALRFATRGPPRAFEADLSAPGSSRCTGGRVSSKLKPRIRGRDD